MSKKSKVGSVVLFVSAVAALLVAVVLLTGRAAYLVGGLGLGVVVSLAFWFVPVWQANRWSKSTEGYSADFEDRARATLAQFLGRIALIVTIAVTLYSVNQTRTAADRSADEAKATLAASERANAIDRSAVRSSNSRHGIGVVQTKPHAWAPSPYCSSTQTLRREKTAKTRFRRPPASWPPTSGATRRRSRTTSNRCSYLAAANPLPDH